MFNKPPRTYFSLPTCNHSHPLRRHIQTFNCKATIHANLIDSTQSSPDKHGEEFHCVINSFLNLQNNFSIVLKVKILSTAYTCYMTRSLFTQPFLLLSLCSSSTVTELPTQRCFPSLSTANSTFTPIIQTRKACIQEHKSSRLNEFSFLATTSPVLFSFSAS